MLDAALGYAAIGWPVFACRGDKTPCFARGTKYGKGVEDATTDPDKVREMWGAFPAANIGFHAGAAGILVVDLDPGHDIDEVNRAFEGLPATALRQKTPRGGDHLFFALAPGEEVALSASKIAPHVDIRSHHSYVLLAPSHTVAGPGCTEGDYTWAHETTWPAQPMPKPAYRTEAMIKACGQKRERATNAQEWLIAPDMPENLDSALRWLQSDKCQPAIEGQGGDARTKDTAAMMRSYGLSEATALNLLFEVYNAKCVPPWDYDDLAVKTANGYRYATSAPGNMTTAYRTALVKQLFHAVEVQLPSGTERSSGRYRIVDRAGIEHIKDPEWLIPDMIPKGGHVTLSGPPGTFKTFLALDILMSVASGSQAGRVWPEIKESGPVLLAVGEGRAGLKLRMEAWEKQHNDGKPVADMVLVDPVPLVSAGPADWEAFVELALSLSPDGYVLTVIDTAGRAMQGLNQNAQEHASMLTQLVGLLQRRLGCAVLVIHHTGHGDRTRAGGSIVFDADADTVLVVSRDARDYLVEISMSKQKDGKEWDQPRTVKLAEVGATLVAVAAPDKSPQSTDATPPSAKVVRASEAAVSGQLDALVSMVLRYNPLRAYSHMELAELLAVREDVDIPSAILHKKLKTLRETSGAASSKCYDPSTKRWRWRA